MCCLQFNFCSTALRTLIVSQKKDPVTVKYTREHEWIRIEGDSATVGITFYAQEQLGDVVFVELPEADMSVDQGAEVAVVESVKAASDIYTNHRNDYRNQ